MYIENSSPTGEMSYLTGDINENLLKSLDRQSYLRLNCTNIPNI
jgi:hypothetical protein